MTDGCHGVIFPVIIGSLYIIPLIKAIVNILKDVERVNGKWTAPYILSFLLVVWYFSYSK